jgi:hypothetical protein
VRAATPTPIIAARFIDPSDRRVTVVTKVGADNEAQMKVTSADGVAALLVDACTREQLERDRSQCFASSRMRF